ncbi:MAG TPA: VIT1/CCC1 transporter family protein [Gaiellaceae bacterium]|nr:VIT1/CCC1 transporter family protein [Gaiellaceae bacterium]
MSAPADTIPSERLPPKRRARGPHPVGGEALRARVLGERGRIARLSRIRELVLGFQDGLLVPLAVVTGLAGANVASSTVIVGGLAEAAAGALAMGTGAFLASQAENQLFAGEIADEEHELADHPEVERLELEILFREEGLDPDAARRASELVARSNLALIKTKAEKELGLPYGETETALGDALVVGGMYALAAVIPLWPYFFLGVGTGLAVSLAATALALFGLGVVKGRVAGMSLLRSGVQVLAIGGASAAIGYLVGSFVPHLFGG